jgi:hypothetical protein
MSIVMFPTARMHICRVARVLRQRRGHAMLIGVGGIGRRSTARLAAFISEMDIKEVMPGSDWKADLRTVLMKVCVWPSKGGTLTSIPPPPLFFELISLFQLDPFHPLPVPFGHWCVTVHGLHVATS